MVELTATSSQRAYATPRSAVPRAPVPLAGHCWPSPPQETLIHSKAYLAQYLWGLLVHSSFSLSPLSLSGPYGVWFQTWLLPSYHLVGASPLPLDVGYLFLVGPNNLLSMVAQQGVIILEFSQEKMSELPSSLPSWHFCVKCLLISTISTLFLVLDESTNPFNYNLFSFLYLIILIIITVITP